MDSINQNVPEPVELTVNCINKFFEIQQAHVTWIISTNVIILPDKTLFPNYNFATIKIVYKKELKTRTILINWKGNLIIQEIFG